MESGGDCSSSGARAPLSLTAVPRRGAGAVEGDGGLFAQPPYSFTHLEVIACLGELCLQKLHNLTLRLENIMDLNSGYNQTGILLFLIHFIYNSFCQHMQIQNIKKPTLKQRLLGHTSEKKKTVVRPSDIIGLHVLYWDTVECQPSTVFYAYDGKFELRYLNYLF